MKNYIVIIFAIISWIAPAKLMSEVFEPQMMPNVNVANAHDFVSDPAHLLNPATLQTVNQQLYDLRQRTSAEVVVALPPDIGEMPIQQWSEKLFTSWGIGKSDKDNGVLIVIAPQSRKTFIMTGYGAEAALPDILCDRIIRNAIIPNMKRNDIDGAVMNAVKDVATAISDPSVAQDIRSSQADNRSGAIKTLSPEVLHQFLGYLIFLIACASIVNFIINLRQARKLDLYHRALFWQGKLKLYTWYAVLSAGFGLIILLCVYLSYRSTRTRKRTCSTCGAKMNRLPEEKDNELLSDRQDLEEQLDSVDYDVWLCPDCGTVERFAFEKANSKYERCERCGTKAAHLIQTRTYPAPNSRRHLCEERIYECKYCKQRYSKRRLIERADDSALNAALGAATILGAASRGGRGHGGFGGGGFGGGDTGGGGAGGSW